MAILSSDRVKMTSILEKAISVIAPLRCIVCGNYDNVVCTACTHTMQRLEVPVCMVCGAVRDMWRPCPAHHSPLAVWVAAMEHTGIAKQLIHAYKFEHVRAAARPLVGLIAGALPYYDETWSVVAIPTIPAHIRERGYDHAALLARELARHQTLRYVAALRRLRDTRQKGATRGQRLAQTQGIFVVTRNIRGKKILLVDDVCTTGATLTAAAEALRAAGALEVHAVVAAYRR